MTNTFKMCIYIVHSHELNDHGEPKQEYKSRLDRLIDELGQGVNSNVNIILTGGKATKGVDIRHCDSGYKYLCSQGIDKNILLLEKDPYGSLETVGEAIFAYIDHKELLINTPAINLISSDYHRKRILAVQRFILGQISNRLNFIGIDRSIHGNYHRTIQQEEKSLETFNTTFSGITPGDVKEIEKRLWKNHPLYKNHPSNPNNTN